VPRLALPHSCWQLCPHGAHHRRLSSASDTAKRRKTSAHPDSLLSEHKAALERRLRLARVEMGPGAKV